MTTSQRLAVLATLALCEAGWRAQTSGSPAKRLQIGRIKVDKVQVYAGPYT
jgi:hypothetical protein